MTASTLLTPTVLWAQRANCIFLTIQLEDCSNPEIKIQPSGVHFRGVGGTDQKEYGIDLELYEPINPEKSEQAVRARNIELVLKKEQEGPYWPRLLKNSGKHHWLKINFEKWVDEDESEEEGAGGMGGMPGMGGMGGMGGGMPGGMGGMQFGGGGGNPFGGGDNPDFEEMMKQMGGLGGGAGMGGGDKPDMEGIGGGESDSDDDNDLPDLE